MFAYITILMFGLVFLRGSSLQLECGSGLCLQFPSLCSHCSCSYGSWSSWAYDSYGYTSTSCSSQKAYRYQRTRQALHNACSPNSETEYRYTCEPTLEDKVRLFAQELSLAGDGSNNERSSLHVPTTYQGNVGTQTSLNYNGFTLPLPASDPNLNIPTQTEDLVERNYCPTESEQSNNKICENNCDLNIGKRKRANLEKEIYNKISSESDKFVEPFDPDNYLKDRRSRPCNKPRYVLFIVDVSGSIGIDDFIAVRDLLGNVSSYLCSQIQVAMITFSDDINLEFCFNCHSSRSAITDAIKRTVRRGGATYTYNAVKCACDEILQPSCGLPSDSDVDVILLTDGRNNGPCRSRLASQIQCLHSRPKTNTYAIGISDYAREAVQQLEDPADSQRPSIFNVADFDELKQFNVLLQQLLTLRDDSGNLLNTCAHIQAGPGGCYNTP